MNNPIKNNELSQDAIEVVEMINEIATDLMFSAYANLSVGMKMKLSELTKNTSKLLGKE